MKFLTRILLACAVCVLCTSPALPQTQPYNTAVLSWTIANSYDDFAPILDPVTYSLYAGKEGITRTRVATDIKATTITRLNVPDGIWCWHVVAVVKGIEGAPSDPVCKTIAKTASNVPAKVTGLTVQ